MKKLPHRLSWTTRLQYRWRLRRALWSKPTIGLVNAPEPCTIGQFEIGQQLVSGKFLITGGVMDFGKGSIWSIAPPSDLVGAELHGFGWLDDLAALGDKHAKAKAQAWIISWIAGFGMGEGPGWSANLTGRRLIRWINNSSFLFNNLSKSQKDRICHSMALQVLLLAKSWRQAQPGWARFEALCGLVCASQSLAGMGFLLAPSLRALVQECQTYIDMEGGINSRNPEELLVIFSSLTWVKRTLDITKMLIPEVLTATISRIAPVLRSLRHGDGTLVRFHGGGQGSEHVLDQALAISEVRPSVPLDEAMGFARLNAGSTSLVVDAVAPPTCLGRFSAHASTGAFEMSVGRNRLILNCGSGASFGEDWHLAGRGTPSHTSLSINGLSSASFVPTKTGEQSPLVAGPQRVIMKKTRAVDGVRLQINHNGYQISHGLIHARTLDLPLDSKGLVGQDELYTVDASDVQRFQVMCANSLEPQQYAIRFHLHPDVMPRLDIDGTAVLLTLVNEDVWVFRHDGSCLLLLEKSVYFEGGRLHPRPTAQIVLSGKIKEITTRVRWSLAKASEKPQKAR